MSDINTSIVPTLSNLPDKEKKITEIVKWLIDVKAIKSEVSDCILSSEKQGYAIDVGASSLVDFPEDLPFNLQVNGLEVITTYTIFHVGEYGIDSIICPNCKEDIAESDLELGEFKR